MSRSLPSGFEGRVIRPDDPEFETARLADNAAFDARPALIARARDAADVLRVIEYVRTTAQPLAIRSGGHSVAGHSTGDGVVVLDVGDLNRLEIDPAAGTVSAGPGVRAAEYTKRTYEHGYATSFGDTGTVGLGGLVLGGGVGWLVRKDGLTIDSLLAAEVVTADGKILVASADEHPDLFWALSGGGGNFGIVTRFDFALRPIGTVLHGALVMPWSRDALREIVELGLAAPDELTLMPLAMALPPIEGVPEREHGRPGVILELLWAGPAAAGDAAIAPFRSLAPVFVDDVAEKPYPAVYPEPTGERSAWISAGLFLDRLDDATIAILERRLSETPGGECLVQLRVLGGAAARIPNDATAYAWRDRPLLAWIIADSGSPERNGLEPFERWVAEFRAELGAQTAGAFVGFMREDGTAAAATAYAPATWARLREIKRRYDPGNLFRRNHNIPPAE